ncbi:MAG TPA: GNAT family N-acetyltransferase [Pyrinomonadaceae bacterium]|jgi:GNAT superfamily N-acetyltransferase
MGERVGLRIEEATKEDVPLILAFIRELAQYEKILDRVTVTEEGLSATLFGRGSYVEAIIAFENDEPVAFAIYFFTYTSFSGLPSLYLEDIFVRAASRGFGIGRQLLAFLARRARQRGCGRMEWSVINWNEPAMAFYKKLGAEPVNDWTVFRLGKDKLEELAKLSEL